MNQKTNPNKNFLYHNGTTMYFKQDGLKVVCVDIDVEPGQKIVYFDAYKIGIEVIANVITTDLLLDINMTGVNKVFPDVETIYIGDMFYNISIDNKMFPNVKLVTGTSDIYIMNKPVLIRKYGANNTLMNTFCQQPGKEINLNGVTNIGPHAFDGCLTSNITDAYALNASSETAFDGYKSSKLRNGAYCAGDIITDFDMNADFVIIRRNAFIASHLRNMNHYLNHAKLQDVCHIDEICAKKIQFLKNAFNPSVQSDLLFLYDMDSYCEEFSCAANDDFINVSDGVLYSKDMKSLIKCPKLKTGTLTIPKKVNRICSKAFMESRLNKIILPTGIKLIEHHAFYNSNIKEIDFNHSNASVNSMAFTGCDNLKNVKLSGKMHGVNASGAFQDCYGLREFEFDDGCESVQTFMFAGCTNLKKLTLPETIKTLSLYENTFFNFTDIMLKSRGFPSNFINAVVIVSLSDTYETMYGAYTVVHLYDGRYICFPKTVTAACKVKLIELFKDYNDVKDIDNSVINELYKYGSTPEVRTFTAIKEYELSGYTNKKALNYAKQKGELIVDYLLRHNDEKRLCLFLKNGIISKTAMKRTFYRVSKEGFTTAKAYMMDCLKGITKNEFVI